MSDENVSPQQWKGDWARVWFNERNIAQDWITAWERELELLSADSPALRRKKQTFQSFRKLIEQRDKPEKKCMSQEATDWLTNAERKLASRRQDASAASESAKSEIPQKEATARKKEETLQTFLNERDAVAKSMTGPAGLDEFREELRRALDDKITEALKAWSKARLDLEDAEKKKEDNDLLVSYVDTTIGYIKLCWDGLIKVSPSPTVGATGSGSRSAEQRQVSA